MSDERDPVRLAELGAEVPRDLVAAIRAVRAQQPSAARVVMAKQRFASIVAASSGGGGPSGQGGMALGAKCLPLAFVVAAGLGVMPRHPAATSHSVVQPAPHVAAPEVVRSEASQAPAPAPVVAAPEPLPAPRRTHRAGRPRAQAVARGQLEATEQAPPVAPDPPAEMALLWRARDALERNPGTTLDLAEQHERAFHDAVFAQEREVLAIEALLKLRRTAPALDRAQRFLQTYPDSAHAERLRSLLDASSSNDP
jgi:hypothetical protein